MDNKHIEWRRQKLKSLREEINAGQLNCLRELLPNEVIETACDKSNHVFRRRLLPPEVTVFHMVSAALSGEKSFQSAWHRSGQKGRSARLAEARKRLPYEVWQYLQDWILREIESDASTDLRWRGHRMIGVDGTGFSMSDTKELAEHFGKRKSQYGISPFPTANVVFAFNLQTLIHLGQAVGGTLTGEKTLFSVLRRSLSPGDVLVMDRYYSGANLYVNYRREGFEFIARTHQRLKVERLKVLEVYSSHDQLVEMPVNAQLRKKDPTLPESTVVRLIRTQIKIRGKRKSFWIATSLLNPKIYPEAEIQHWYKQRWKVETLIREVKESFGTSILRSKSVSGILKELQACLLAMNLIHWLILKAAQSYSQPHYRISTSAAIRLVSAYSLKMSTAPAHQLSLLYEQLLERIAFSLIPKRDNRSEPRALRRDPHRRYPKLKITRSAWRTLCLDP